MGGGKKSKAPKAPNYEQLAKQEADQSYKIAQDVTRWNRPTQIDPYGNKISWTQDAKGNWTQQQTLNPQFKEAQNRGLSGYNQAMGQAQAAAQRGFKAPEAFKLAAPRDQAGTERALDVAGAGNFTNTAGAIGNFDRTQGDKVARDMYESVMGRARPEQQRQQAALDVKLRQQGLQPGTEAYNRAMQNMLTAHGDVATQAGLNATQAGYNTARDIYNTNLGGQGQRFQQLADTYGINQAQDWRAFEGERSLNQDQLMREQLRMGAQNQAYSQALKNYQMPFDIAGSMANLYAAAPRPEFAGFSGATGYNPANLMGAAQAKYESQMGGYNAGQNKKGSGLGMLGTLGSSAIRTFG